MYALEIIPEADRIFRKLSRKNRPLIEAIEKKIAQIRENPHHFKPLRFPMNNKRRVHVGGSFVLIYEIRESDKTVKILDFDHHDNIY